MVLGQALARRIEDLECTYDALDVARCHARCRHGIDLLQALVDGGADLIELGVPFSDPIADGPVIQRAASRALASGTTLSGVLRLVARHRARLGVPIILFSYYNPIHVRGVETFAEQAAGSGVDGVLCVDLPPEEGQAAVRFQRGEEGQVVGYSVTTGRVRGLLFTRRPSS